MVQAYRLVAADLLKPDVRARLGSTCGDPERFFVLKDLTKQQGFRERLVTLLPLRTTLKPLA